MRIAAILWIGLAWPGLAASPPAYVNTGADKGFFPLGAWQQPGAATRDGLARLSRPGEGLMVLFKNESGVTSAGVKIPVPASSRSPGPR